MQRNQSIIILGMSFSFYSHLGTTQSKREDNVMLLNQLLNADILQIKTYQKILDIFMRLLPEIRNPVLFSPHKQLWLWDLLLEETFPVADLISSLHYALAWQSGHEQAATWERKIAKRGENCASTVKVTGCRFSLVCLKNTGSEQGRFLSVCKSFTDILFPSSPGALQ